MYCAYSYFCKNCLVPRRAYSTTPTKNLSRARTTPVRFDMNIMKDVFSYRVQDRGVDILGPCELRVKTALFKLVLNFFQTMFVCFRRLRFSRSYCPNTFVR